MTFHFSFWGVRGSLSCAKPDFMKYGGNTSCVYVKVGDQHLILDAGTGIRDLGHHLLKNNITHTHLLFSHTHWDHVMGFPFFKSVFFKDHKIDIFGHADPQIERPRIKEILSQHMDSPFFPVPLEKISSQISFHDFVVGNDIDIGGNVTIQTTRLNHPGGSCGYRINYKGKSLCYITDTEHIIGEVDQQILNLIAGADAMIYDCTYTEENFENHIGWGHSCWQAGYELCKIANVKKLFMFHHDLEANDVEMERIELQARKVSENIVAAREGMSIALIP